MLAFPRIGLIRRSTKSAGSTHLPNAPEVAVDLSLRGEEEACGRWRYLRSPGALRATRLWEGKPTRRFTPPETDEEKQEGAVRTS